MLFVGAMFFTSAMEAQILIQNGRVTNCGGVFYDSGGRNGNYGNRENYVFTICSSDPRNSHITLGFDLLDINSGDELCFYDGANVNAPLIACDDDLRRNQNAIIQATAANTSGCITVRFRSNFIGTARGWAANIICSASCQPIRAVIDSVAPPRTVADTGWVNVCPKGVPVTFSGKGFYPQSGAQYTQNDSLSRFEWNFGDGSPIVYGKNVSHVFAQSGGYNVALTIKDTLGCSNTNFIKQRVRVAPKPTINLTNIPAQVCAGAEIKLNARLDKLDPNFNLSAQANEGAFDIRSVRSERLFIPDNPAQQYSTSIILSDFAQGQTLNNVNDLLGILLIWNIHGRAMWKSNWFAQAENRLCCTNMILIHAIQMKF
ncbi:MAG: PKD domain-containing protein [Saprospiraceae bacterium]|nr:PKD domain-containing protein [Saprospiraceae bacterium]